MGQNDSRDVLPFNDPADNQASVIRIFGRIVIVLILALIASIATTFYALKTIEVSLPPDPSQGALLKRDVKTKSSIYTFTLWHFQKLQHWPSAGQVDYRKNIDALNPVLTPEYKAFLDRDYERRKEHGELNNRIRHIEPYGMAYDDKRVQPLGPGSWVVIADYVVKEWYLGADIKQVPLRYYLLVTETSVTEDNRFGLRLAGFERNPENIREREEK